MERKNLSMQVEDSGEVTAIIATFGAIDKDGDVIEKGAFNGASVPIIPAHQKESIPLGKATVEERGDAAVAVGRFNLATTAGAEWFKAIKFDLEDGNPRQEWSWGFTIPEGGSTKEVRDGKQVRVIKAVDLIEISPVLRGASVGTRTLSAKEEAAAEEPKPGIKLADQVRAVTKDAEAAISRLRSASHWHLSEGRDLKDDTKADAVEMATMVDEMIQLSKQLAALVDHCAPKDGVSQSVARWRHHQARYGGSV